MSELQLTYIFNREELNYTLNNINKDKDKDKDKWKFIDQLIIKENDKFIIYDKDKNVDYKLNLYQKTENFYIFSCLACLSFDVADIDYDFFFIWNKTNNLYCYLQNNKKIDKVKDDFNGIILPDESFFMGLFKNNPKYYLDNKNYRLFNQLPKLPIHAVKCLEINDDYSNISSCNFVPITRI